MIIRNEAVESELLLPLLLLPLKKRLTPDFWRCSGDFPIGYR